MLPHGGKGKGDQNLKWTYTQQTGPDQKSLSCLCSEGRVENQERQAKMNDEICTRCPQLQVSMGVTYEGFQKAGEVGARSIAEFLVDGGMQEDGKPAG